MAGVIWQSVEHASRSLEARCQKLVLLADQGPNIYGSEVVYLVVVRVCPMQAPPNYCGCNISISHTHTLGLRLGSPQQHATNGFPMAMLILNPYYISLLHIST